MKNFAIRSVIQHGLTRQRGRSGVTAFSFLSALAIALVGLSCLLSACAPMAPAALEAPISVPSAFKGDVSKATLSRSSAVATATATATASLNRASASGSGVPAWWEVFADAQLNTLIAQANAGNASLEMAAARLAQARAQAHQTGAARAPAVSLEGGAARQQGPLLNAAGEEGTLLTARATVAYELDLLGRLAQTHTAAALDAEARAALLRGAQLLVQTQVAQHYFAVQALEEDLDWLSSAREANDTKLRIQQDRLNLGSVSESELEPIRTTQAALATESIAVQRQRIERVNAIATLVGMPASGFSLPRQRQAWQLPSVRPGLPAAVLARRPDVEASLSSLQAAQQRLGAARTNWLPNLTLTAAGGYASPDVRTLFSASMQTLVVGALASLPLLDGGRREAGVSLAEAELRAAMAEYKERMLVALGEVEDQLAATRALAQQQEIAARVLVSAERIERLAASRYRNGLVSQREWLEAQEPVQQARRRLAQLRAQQVQTSLDLVRVLGGGWN